MLNQIVVVGRVININENEIEISVLRSYKNEKGEYEEDKIKCQIWGGIKEQCKEYMNKMDVVGIKGRLQTEDDKLIVVAEKVTVLSSKKGE